jgi:hypothetical protein
MRRPAAYHQGQEGTTLRKRTTSRHQGVSLSTFGQDRECDEEFACMHELRNSIHHFGVRYSRWASAHRPHMEPKHESAQCRCAWLRSVSMQRKITPCTKVRKMSTDQQPLD